MARRTYYQIELTARQLTVLLVILAVLLIAAFVLGYAAAWTTRGPRAAAVPSVPPTPVEEVVVPSPTPVRRPSPAATPGPVPSPAAAPTAGAAAVRPTRAPSRTTTATAKRRPPARRFWVQLVAARHRTAIARARRRAARLGFPKDHQKVITVRAEAGNLLYKLRVGPFPDRPSADRVMRRIRAEGFPDAWVVAP